MDKQEIILTLYSEPTDFKCENSKMSVRLNIIGADGRKMSVKGIAGIGAEALFGLVRDLINSADKKLIKDITENRNLIKEIVEYEK